MQDEERFTEIFRSFYAKVTAFAWRRIDRETAKDVVADTFLAAWRHLDRLPDDPLPWLYRAASFEIAQRHRQIDRDAERSRRAGLEADLTEPDVAQDVVRRKHWRSAFSHLDETDREILRLVAWEGLGPAAAAAVLGCSTVAFKVRLHRARRRLTSLVTADTPTESPNLRLLPKEARS